MQERKQLKSIFAVLFRVVCRKIKMSSLRQTDSEKSSAVHRRKMQQLRIFPRQFDRKIRCAKDFHQATGSVTGFPAVLAKIKILHLEKFPNGLDTLAAIIALGVNFYQPPTTL